MTETILFSLLRAAISTETVESDKITDLKDDALVAVHTLAKRHDMAHLIGHALESAGWCNDGELSWSLHKRTMQAVYRYARQQDEFEQIAQLLEEAQIPYIPLKGSVIRDWYPEPWMRTSTDIDILIRKKDLETGIHVLSEKLGYRHQGTAFHDASLFSPSGVHLELHYELADATVQEKVRQRLADVWDHASPADGSAYRFVMDEDWFYLYHICHMTRHLITGGCGIKPFLDLWIMKNKMGLCAQRFANLLDSCDLLTAAQTAEKLAEIWFFGEEMDDLSGRLASFVLSGGVHGTMDGNVAVAQARSGGRFRNLSQKIFLPYDIMKELYPFLTKHKWLLPTAQVFRWFRLLFSSRFHRTAKILWKNITFSEDDRDNTEKLLRDLDLL